MRLAAALAALAFVAAPAATQMPATEPLAREALREALAMPAAAPREEVLRAVSRTLRRRHRGLAMDAARAMREPFELSSFALRTEQPLAVEETPRAREEQDARCAALPRARMSPAELEEQADYCFLWDHCEPASCRPPRARLVEVAAALRPGSVRRDLLLSALVDAWDEGDPTEARRVLALVRALRPQLARPLRAELDRSLRDFHVDLLDGRPDLALARVRGGESAGTLGSLVALLVRRGLIDEARAALAALAEREGCIQPDSLAELYWVGLARDEDAAALAAFLDSLAPSRAGACPHGLRPTVRARMELNAERPERALEAAAAIADPAEAARTRLDVATHLLVRRRDAEARPLLIALAERLPQLARPVREAGAGALQEPVAMRIDLIYGLAWVGEAQRAADVARAFPSAGWRAWGLALVAAEQPGEGGPGARERVMQLEPSDVPVFD